MQKKNGDLIEYTVANKRNMKERMIIYEKIISNDYVGGNYSDKL